MTKFLGNPRVDKIKGVKNYQDNGVQVRPTFDHGVCNKIIYISDKGRKFNDHWVSATLALNSEGRAWITREATKPQKVFYHSGDGKFYARLTNGNELGVLTDELVKKASMEAKPKTTETK